MNDALDLYRRAVAEFDRRVAAVPDHRWASPTPCSEWDVRALVNHLVYEDLWAKELLEGRTLDEVGDRFDGDNLGDDPKAAWAAARDSARAAAHPAPRA
ncbi:MAG: maleylpyruvate isomerase N-terminal domain-containing protein, partial [Acidimicrobiia bacterium]